MKVRFCLLGVLAFLTLFTCVNAAFAQAGLTGAQLNGTVLDESGGVVNKAAINLREVNTNLAYNTSSNDSGYYVVPNVAPGRYDLKVTFAGFANYTHTGIVLSVGQLATVNVTLKVAARGEQVVVSTETPLIEPTKTEISQVIDTQQIASLPISGRLFTDFALLTPGVATSRTSLGTTFTEFETTQISFGGMRSFSNEITVDGADFVNATSGVQRATPPQEAVQEFRVVNNSFAAEYGRALGGIVNIVTKSGTNSLHGSLYDYFQNSAMDARSALQPAPLPHELRQNQFGGTLGGPISKDKTFFFVNYEGKRRGESPTYPPDLVNNIDTIDLAKSYLGLPPEGGVAGFAGLQGFLKTNDNDYGFARLDHQINSNNRLAIRYSIEDARDLGELVGNTLDGGGIGAPSGGRSLFIRDQSLVGTLNTLIKPSLVNTFLAQYARRHYNFPGSTGEPDLSVVNDLEFGHNFGTYDRIYESRVQASDSIAWVKGNHLAKFGFDGNYVWAQTNFPGFTPERILFPDLNCVNFFANFVEFGNPVSTLPGAIPTPVNCPLSGSGATPGPTVCAGTPAGCGADGVQFLYMGVSLSRNGFVNGEVPPPATGAGFGGGWPNAFPVNRFSNYAYNLNHGYWGIYAQDQWRITPKLTLNYGLRWDYESGLAGTIDSYYMAFQPRVGLAYSPDGKTVIRAGFGIFFDRNNMTFFHTPGGQKTIPGFMCNPPTAPGCDGATEFMAATPVMMPMVRKGAETAGWQLSGLPGFPATPADVAAGIATSILAGNPYLPQSLSGICDQANGFFACGVGAGGMDHKVSKLPYAEQASIQIDRQIGRGLTLDFGYLFVGAHRLVRGNNINVPCPIGTSKPSNPADVQGWLNPNGTLSACSGTPTIGPLGIGPVFPALPFSDATATSACPYPYQSPIPFAPNPDGFACIGNPTGLEFGGAPFSPSGLSGGLLDYNNDVAKAAYHGLTVTAIEKWGKYLNLSASYTYSHSIDNGNFTTFVNLPPNQFDYKAERANSNQDARHRFVTNFTVDAPKSSLLRNFALSSIITLQSGRPFTIFAGEDTLGDLAGLATDRTAGSPVVANCPTVDNCTTQIPRNTYIGDPLRTWDLRISRYFEFKEHMRVDLAFDAFNLLNRANVDEVTSVYGPVFCGDTPVIPRHFNDAISRTIQSGAVSCASQVAATFGPGPLNFPGGAFIAQGMLPVSIPDNPNRGFGLPRTMLNPRQLQFSAKFSF